MQCHEIMTGNVETVAPYHSVEFAARKMCEQMLGFLPVCNAELVPVGVLTDRDIATRVCAAGRSAVDTMVEEIMSRPGICCEAYAPMARVERLMVTHRITRLLVTDDDRRLVGVVSLTDLAQAEEPLRAARLLREISSRAFRVESPRSVRSVAPPADCPPTRSRRRRRANAG